MKTSIGGCFVLLLIFNVLFGGFATQYVFDHVFHKGIGFGLAALVGLVAGEFLVPAWLITFILVLAGVLS